MTGESSHDRSCHRYGGYTRVHEETLICFSCFDKPTLDCRAIGELIPDLWVAHVGYMIYTLVLTEYEVTERGGLICNGRSLGSLWSISRLTAELLRQYVGVRGTLCFAVMKPGHADPRKRCGQIRSRDP